MMISREDERNTQKPIEALNQAQCWWKYIFMDIEEVVIKRQVNSLMERSNSSATNYINFCVLKRKKKGNNKINGHKF